MLCVHKHVGFKKCGRLSLLLNTLVIASKHGLALHSLSHTLALFVVLVLGDRVSLCSPSLPGTPCVDQAGLRDLPASAFQVLVAPCLAQTCFLGILSQQTSIGSKVTFSPILNVKGPPPPPCHQTALARNGSSFPQWGFL